MADGTLAEFLDRVGLVLVLDHAGRAGNGFFLSIFDQHPEVITCPWMHYTYSYLVTRFAGAAEFDAAEARAFWTGESYFRFVYRDPDDALSREIRKFGGDPEAPIDRAAVRRTFDDFLSGRERVTRRELVGITYLAYAVGTARDLSRIRHILVSDSISLRTERVLDGFSGRVVDAVVHDFGNPRFVHLVRDPRAGLASSRHQYVNSLGNMYGIRCGNYWRRFARLLRLDFDWDSVFVFGFWLMYFGQTFKAAMLKRREHPGLFLTVRNEDLNLRFADTLRRLCAELGVTFLQAWAGQGYAPTMAGRPWAGTGAYNSTYQPHRFGPLENDPDEVARTVTGPNAYVTQRWRQRLRRNEVYLIECLLRPEFEAFGYACEECLPGRRSKLGLLAALARPLSGELPTLRWILRGRNVGPGEVGQRLFYVLGFPLFYVASRLALLAVALRKDIFPGTAR